MWVEISGPRYLSAPALVLGNRECRARRTASDLRSHSPPSQIGHPAEVDQQDSRTPRLALCTAGVWGPPCPRPRAERRRLRLGHFATSTDTSAIAAMFSRGEAEDPHLTARRLAGLRMVDPAGTSTSCPSIVSFGMPGSPARPIRHQLPAGLLRVGQDPPLDLGGNGGQTCPPSSSVAERADGVTLVSW